MKKSIKTYILKYEVYSNECFPPGTTVTITDDYWQHAINNSNTGFTVIKGKLKGRNGYVANGLNGWLLNNTIKNRKICKEYKRRMKELEEVKDILNKKWNALPTVKL